MARLKILILSPAEKRFIREKYNIPQSTINYALSGKRDTTLVMLIRGIAENIIKNRDLNTEPHDA